MQNNGFSYKRLHFNLRSVKSFLFPFFPAKLHACWLFERWNVERVQCCDQYNRITKIWQSFHCWILTTCNSNIFDLRVRLKRRNVHSGVGWTIICLLSAVTANSGKYIKCNKVVRNQRGRHWTLWRKHKPQISQVPLFHFATHVESSVFPVLGQILFETNFFEVVFR